MFMVLQGWPTMVNGRRLEVEVLKLFNLTPIGPGSSDRRILAIASLEDLTRQIESAQSPQTPEVCGTAGECPEWTEGRGAGSSLIQVSLSQPYPT